MQQLDEYLSFRKQVHEYFGYIEDWRVFPIDDRREYYWRLDGEVEVQYGSTPDFLSNEDDLYGDTVYHYVHLSKWVYRAESYTMVVVDTMTDGNILLAIYDNTKEIT